MPTINLRDTGSERRPKRQMHERAHKESRYNGRRWRGLRDFVISNNPFCIECQQVATVVDHVQPVRLGGQFYAVDNLQPMCAPCHNSKSAKEKLIGVGGNLKKW